MSVLMQCGHVASGTNSKGDPSCISCTGLTPLADMVAQDQPSLEGRIATCEYCRKEAPSSFKLPFFSYNEKYTDKYYCGCYGWE